MRIHLVGRRCIKDAQPELRVPKVGEIVVYMRLKIGAVGI